MEFILPILIAAGIGLSFGLWQENVYAGQWMFLVVYAALLATT